MPRPTKDPSEQRTRAHQVKFTEAEEAAYIRIKEKVASGGPVALDQHFLLWLVAEEGRRRGEEWPTPSDAPVRPTNEPSRGRRRGAI